MTLWAFALSLLIAEPGVQHTQRTQRFALLIGSNVGNASENPLMYARNDARTLAQTLTLVADTPQDHIMVLGDPDDFSVRSHFQLLHDQINDAKARGDATLVFVYFSGHADALSIHLGDETLLWNELLALTRQTGASTRVLIVDACRSGALTRVKGGRRVPAFELPVRDNTAPEGLAILASSSANESAQESDALRGSVFTHHFIEALRGAADKNSDGRVSLSEAFQYSADSTAFTSAQADEGAQHASFRYHMQGRSELTLSHPVASKNMGFVALNRSGEYRFFLGDATGPVLLDAVTETAKRSVTLPAARYLVQAKVGTQLRMGTITVVAGESVDMDVDGFDVVPTMQVATKGGNEVSTPVTPPVPLPRWSVIASAGTGKALLDDFSVPWIVGVVGTYRFDAVLLDLQVQVQQTHGSNNLLSTTALDLGALAGVRFYTQQGRLLLSAGPRAGILYIQQSYSGVDQPASRWQLAPQLQAVGAIDYNITEHFFVGVEGGVRLALLRLAAGSDSSFSLDVQPFGTLGVGVRW